MAKKSKAEKIRPNGGYSNAGQQIKMWNKMASKVDTSWMDNLQGGSWKDDTVLRDYIRDQLK